MEGRRSAGRAARVVLVAALITASAVAVMPAAASAVETYAGRFARPGPPTALTAAARDHGALLSWSPPASAGGSPITGYVITAMPGAESVNTSAVRSYVVGGLANGTAYKFTVAAVNASGTGPPSRPSAAITPRAPAVPGPVRSMTAAAGFRQISVTWTAPKSDGGAPVTAYLLAAKPAIKDVTVGGSARSATLTGLAEGTAYRVSVVAMNIAGHARAVWSGRVTPAVTVPGGPVSVIAAPASGRQVRVTWTAPLSDGGSPLTGYLIEVSGTGKTVNARPSASSVTVNGLTSGHSYTVTVAAKNAKGKGPAVFSTSVTAGAAARSHLVVLSAASLAALATVGTDGSLIFNNPPAQVARLAAGDIVAAGISTTTPAGLLVTVRSVSTSGSTLTAQTVPASLDEALKTAGFGTSMQLTRGQVTAFAPARPGVRLLAAAMRPASAAPGSIAISLHTNLYSSSNGRKVTADGTVSLTPDFSFHASISCCFHTSSEFDATDTAAAAVDFTAQVSHSFSGSYTLGTFRFRPITFDVAGVPVVIVPSLTVKLIADGQVVAGLSAAAGASVTAGVRATTKDASVFAQPVFEKTVYYTPPILYGSLSANGGAEADLSATVDGVAGATLTDQLWLAELSADISKTPWWTLSSENVLKLDLNLSLLHHSFADYHKTIADQKTLLARAPGPYQGITITPVPAAVQPGGQLQLHAVASGAPEQNVIWNAPPGNGAITGGGLYTAPSAPGVYQVTALQPAAGLRPAAYGLASIRAGDQPPSSPLDPSATSSSYGTATISWNPPASTGGGTITGYTITANPGGQNYPVVAPAVSDTVGGVAPGATYTFTITVTSDGGTSRPSPSTDPVRIDNVPSNAGPWTAAKAPLPVGGDQVQGTGLPSVACPGPADCVAVGGYYDGTNQGVLLTGGGNSWTPVKAPLPSNALADPYAALSAVTCPSTAMCLAAGLYADDSGGWAGVLVTGAGSSWTAAEAPAPSNATPGTGGAVNAVACASPAACAAVGTYEDSSGSSQGLLLSWSGSTWTPAEAPLPTSAAANPAVIIGSVACPSTTMCAAAGTYTDAAGQTQGVILTGWGTSWKAVKVPLPSGAGTGAYVDKINSVACLSPSSCVAVGSYFDSARNYLGLIVTGARTTWTATRAPVPSDSRSNPSTTLLSAACASKCVVVGGYYNKSSDGQGLVLTGTGASWTASRAPLPGNAAKNLYNTALAGLTSVTCPSTGTCVAVGSYLDSSGDDQSILLTGFGGSWTVAESPVPADTASNSGATLQSVACASVSTCEATGDYLDTLGLAQGLLVNDG